MGAYKFSRLLMVAVLIGIFMISTQAWGTIWSVDKECAEFGHIDQNTLDRFEGDWLGNVACAPTATMNSFIYLQNHYPGIYDNLLVPLGPGQDIIRARELALQWMNTTPQGTTIYDWAWGKYLYLENYAPGKTVYHGQTTYNGWTVGRPRPGWMQPVMPQWDFLFGELYQCQDVEIGIQWGSDIGHALTLCCMTWDDELNVGTIKYIDPDDGVCHDPVPLNFDPDTGKLQMVYNGNTSWIDVALAESVPEPSSILILGSGFVGILIRLRRRRD